MVIFEHVKLEQTSVFRGQIDNEILLFQFCIVNTQSSIGKSVGNNNHIATFVRLHKTVSFNKFQNKTDQIDK